MVHLHINTDPLPPLAEVNPEELREVEEMLECAHAAEPIRTVEDLHQLGRAVVVQGKMHRKDYGQEWPHVKAKYLPILFGAPAMSVVRFSAQPA